MKTILLATAAAALFAAPAFAQDAVGSVGVTYSNPSIEVAGNDVDADVWTVDGTVALPAADWTVTLNGAVDYTKAFGEEDVTGVAAAHLTKMWTSDVRAGAFVAANGIGSGDEPVWTVGAEAQKYLSNATLTGLVAYTTADDADADIWTVGGDAALAAAPLSGRTMKRCPSGVTQIPRGEYVSATTSGRSFWATASRRDWFWRNPGAVPQIR